MRTNKQKYSICGTYRNTFETEKNMEKKKKQKLNVIKNEHIKTRRDKRYAI